MMHNQDYCVTQHINPEVSAQLVATKQNLYQMAEMLWSSKYYIHLGKEHRENSQSFLVCDAIILHSP